MKTTPSVIRPVLGPLVAVVVLLVLIDAPIAPLAFGASSGTMGNIMAIVCAFPFYAALFATPLYWNRRSGAYPTAVIALGTAFAISFIAKQVFQAIRPFVTYGWPSVEALSDYGFPSAHAATAFALLPVATAFATAGWRRAWIAFAVMIAAFRMALGMHYASDVVAGTLLGLWCGSWAVRMTPGILAHIQESILRDRENLRQLVHALVGLALVLLLHASLITAEWLLVLLATGAIATLWQRHRPLGILSRILGAMERDGDRHSFPGRGAFFYVAGSLLAVVCFAPPIALSAIAVLAIGDALSNVIGRHAGRHALPHNRSKTWEGTAAGIIGATLSATVFVPLPAALVGAMAAMALETLPLHRVHARLDDNLLIPLAAGTAMTVFVALFPSV